VHGGYFLVGCRPVGAPRKLNLHCLLGSTTYRRGWRARIRAPSEERVRLRSVL